MWRLPLATSGMGCLKPSFMKSEGYQQSDQSWIIKIEILNFLDRLETLWVEKLLDSFLIRVVLVKLRNPVKVKDLYLLGGK